jgi:hypothetical protein
VASDPALWSLLHFLDRRVVLQARNDCHLLNMPFRPGGHLNPYSPTDKFVGQMPQRFVYGIAIPSTPAGESSDETKAQTHASSMRYSYTTSALAVLHQTLDSRGLRSSHR